MAAGWNVFGGYTYRESYATTQINYTGPCYKAVQDSFAVAGLLANYQVDEHLSVGLNVEQSVRQEVLRRHGHVQLRFLRRAA